MDLSAILVFFSIVTIAFGLGELLQRFIEERKRNSRLKRIDLPNIENSRVRRLYERAAQIAVCYSMAMDSGDFGQERERSRRIDQLRYLVERFEADLFRLTGREFHSLCLSAAALLCAGETNDAQLDVYTKRMKQFARDQHWAPEQCSIAGLGAVLLVQYADDSIRGKAIAIAAAVECFDRDIAEPLCQAYGTRQPHRAA